MDEAVGDLEQACSAIIAQVVENHAKATAVAETAEKRVAEVNAEADAAVQRAQLEAQIKIVDLEGVIERLRSELQAQREPRQVAPLYDGDGENPKSDGELQPIELVALYRSQLLAVREELKASRMECSDLARQREVEKANRARLMAAVQAIQHGTPSERIRSNVRTASSLPAYIESAKPSCEQTEPAVNDSAAVTPAERAIISSGRPSPHTSTTGAASDTQSVAGGLEFDPPEYAQQLLDNIEAVYAADVASGVVPDDLVDRLASNLTYGAEVFARRLEYASVPRTTIFERELTSLLNTKGETSFGRRLAVAAHRCERQRIQLDHAQVA